MKPDSVLRPLVALAAVCVLVAALAARMPAPESAGVAHRDGRARIVALLRKRVSYVFVIYQENRSFDSYFGTFPGADGLYSRPAAQTPGFTQPIIDTDGRTTVIQPFRIGPRQYAADTDDVDHSHGRIVAKMDLRGGMPRMDRFALVEERKYAPHGTPSLEAKQFGELAMAYEDCDTVPFLWYYASRFVLFDHIFQEMTGPSTPGNLSIIAAQTGVTQYLLHPGQGVKGDGDKGPGVPVLNDSDPFWGSPEDHQTHGQVPANPRDFPRATIQDNLTFASLPLTLQGKSIGQAVRADAAPGEDLRDVRQDVAELSRTGGGTVPWGWYEEGYDREPTDGQGPVDAEGEHASYVTHHNGPQYFGYIANNDRMRAHLHGLDDFFVALQHHTLPAAGVYYIKGGFRNIMGLEPADPDARVRKDFLGDDDHPGYSDAQISEALVAELVNRIARSPYWSKSAIVITWDDSEGDYDSVRPPVRERLPGIGVITDGPRVPLILISPYARTHDIAHAVGDQASVVKLVDMLFDLTPLAKLPDESRAREIGRRRFGESDLGPLDAAPGISALLAGFDPARLEGTAPPLPRSYVELPDRIVHALPERSGFGCNSLGIVPTNVRLHIPNRIPADFNPRPRTDPSRAV